MCREALFKRFTESSSQCLERWRLQCFHLVLGCKLSNHKYYCDKVFIFTIACAGQWWAVRASKASGQIIPINALITIFKFTMVEGGEPVDLVADLLRKSFSRWTLNQHSSQYETKHVLRVVLRLLKA